MPQNYSLLEAYKLKLVLMKVVQIPEPLWAEMTQPLGRPPGKEIRGTSCFAYTLGLLALPL